MLVPAAQVAPLGLEAAESARMMRLSSLRISNLSLRLAKGSPFHRPANFLQIKLSRDRASLGGPEQTGESVEPIQRRTRPSWLLSLAAVDNRSLLLRGASEAVCSELGLIEPSSSRGNRSISSLFFSVARFLIPSSRLEPE